MMKAKEKLDRAVLRWDVCVPCGGRCWNFELLVCERVRATGEIARRAFNDPNTVEVMIRRELGRAGLS